MTSSNWQVAAPERLDKFRWLTLTHWISEHDGAWVPFDNLIEGVVLIVEFVLIAPTAGLVRLAIHRSRSRGWRVRARRGNTLVEWRTRKKRQARRLTRVLRTELGRGADIGSPVIQAAVAGNEAVYRPQPPLISGTI